MSRSVREDIARAERLLSTHEPTVAYDSVQGLVRHRLLVEQGSGPPAFAEHVPKPGRVRWLGVQGTCLAGLLGALLLLWWAPWRDGSVAPIVGPSTAAGRNERSDAPVPTARPVPVSAAGGSVSQPARPQQGRQLSADNQADETVVESAPLDEPVGERASVGVSSNPQRHAPPVAPRQLTRPHRTRLRRAAAATPDDLLEMREVARAEQLLESQPSESLQLVREGQRRFRSGYFDQERRYLEILALVKLDRWGEARAQAWSFFQDYPRGPYRQRIEAALGSMP